MPKPSSDEMDAFMKDALKEILKTEDFHRFLHWMHQRMGVSNQLSLIPRQDTQLKASATSMALSLWNATPLPGNGFRPNPVPVPKRNDPCACGSGKKFKKCCSIGSNNLPPLASEGIWPMLLEIMPVKTLKKAIRDGVLPLNGRVTYCEQLLVTGQFRKIIDLLQPYYLAKSYSQSNELAGFGVSILCDAYDGLMLFDKKIHLLDHVMQHAPPSALRSDALQRRASIYADAGELDKAFICVKKARKDTPKDQAVALLEIQLLLMSDKCDLAVNRARFLHKLVQRDLENFYLEDENPMLEFLELVIESPEDAKALLQPGATGKDRKIAEWLEQNGNRPVVPYQLSEIEDLAPNKPGSAGFGMPHFTIVPPGQIFDIEAEWMDICPITPLFGIQLDPMPPEFPWDEEDDSWQNFILLHPNLLDSLLIVDELLTIFTLHPFAIAPDFRQKMFEPLLNRGLMIINAMLDKLPANGCLPWIVPENRPLLRILVRKLENDSLQSEKEAVLGTMEQLLSLNPQDNHGFRGDLVNIYLRQGKNEQVLDLIEQYPDDILTDLLYGKVLAMFRLGRKDDALEAARVAKEQAPQIASYLCSPKRSAPKNFSPYGMVYGGKEEAYQYRQEMRDVWKSTRGALALLKKA